MASTARQIYEQLLVTRCQVGDEAAFAELLALYDQRIRYYVRKIVTEPHAADDVVQETWLDVHRGIRKLRESGHFRTWLYRVARNRALSILRHRRPTVSLGQEVMDRQSSHAESVAQSDDLRQLHAGLDRLSAEHREVLVLRYLEEMSYEEISAIVEVNLGTVRSRLHYAKGALRKLLKKEALK